MGCVIHSGLNAANKDGGSQANCCREKQRPLGGVFLLLQRLGQGKVWRDVPRTHLEGEEGSKPADAWLSRKTQRLNSLAKQASLSQVFRAALGME